MSPAAKLPSVVLLFVLFSACSSRATVERSVESSANPTASGRNSGTLPETDPVKERARLIRALADRAERASTPKGKQGEQSAWYVYSFIVRADPKDEVYGAKFRSLGGWDAGIPYTHPIDHGRATAGLFQMSGRIAYVLGLDNVKIADLTAPFPADPSRMEMTNLRMLLDEELTGDLSYCELGSNEQASATSWMFLSNPVLSLPDVLKKYGEPQARRGDTATYGRLRIILANAGRVGAVQIGGDWGLRPGPARK